MQSKITNHSTARDYKSQHNVRLQSATHRKITKRNAARDHSATRCKQRSARLQIAEQNYRSQRSARLQIETQRKITDRNSAQDYRSQLKITERNAAQDFRAQHSARLQSATWSKITECNAARDYKAQRGERLQIAMWRKITECNSAQDYRAQHGARLQSVTQVEITERNSAVRTYTNIKSLYLYQCERRIFTPVHTTCDGQGTGVPNSCHLAVIIQEGSNACDVLS